MSVIIRGGRMPSGCGMCVMSRYFFSTGTTVCMLTLATLAENYTVASSDRRHEDCPLVELPEKHGRLIDASKLKETLAYYIAEAKHSETEEELVVYRSLETGKTWVCPKAIFFGKTDDGRPRFTKVITRLEKVLCDKKAMRDLLIKDNCPHHFGLEDYETAGNHGCMGVKCEDCWNERAEEHDET